MKHLYRVLLSVAFCMTVVLNLQAQEFTQEQLDAVQRVVASKLPEHMGVGQLKLRSLTFENDTVKVDVSENFGDVPFTQAGVEQMRAEIREALGDDYGDSEGRKRKEGNLQSHSQGPGLQDKAQQDIRICQGRNKGDAEGHSLPFQCQQQGHKMVLQQSGGCIRFLEGGRKGTLDRNGDHHRHSKGRK